MKDFVGKLQKELAHLQKTLKQEGDDLVKKLRTVTNKKSLKATGKQIEKMVEMRLKKFEPQVSKVVSDLRKSAKKAGLNVDAIEKLGVKTKRKAAGKTTVKSRKAPARTRPTMKRGKATGNAHEPAVN